MCQRPTKEETTRNEAIRAASFTEGPEPRRTDGSREPGDYPEPRGNGDYDRREAERSEEKLATVLGH